MNGGSPWVVQESPYPNNAGGCRQTLHCLGVLCSGWFVGFSWLCVCFFLLFVHNSLGPLTKCCCGKCRSWVGEAKRGFWEYFAPGLSEVTSLRGRLHVYFPPGGTRRTWFCWLNFMVCSCLGSIWKEQEFLGSRVKLATNEASQMFFGVLWCSDPRGQAGESISGRWRSRTVL